MAQRQWRSDDTDTWVYGFGDGSDGALTISSNTTEAPIDSSCSGTSGTTSLSATNASFAAGQIIMIHQTRGTGAGGWELNKIASYTAGTITTSHALTMTYTDSGSSQAQVRVLKQYSSVTIDNTFTYNSKDFDGNVGGIGGWFCSGTTTIAGTFNVSGNNGQIGSSGSVNSIVGVTGIGFIGGTGVENGGAYKGEGTTGAITVGTTANGNGGGGGLKSGGTDGDGATGGGGGHSASGGNGQTYGSGATAGAGGSSSGTASLITMTMGGGGGGGSQGTGTTYRIASGGSGGGIAFIASKNITVTGLLKSNGGAGGGGANVGGSGGGGAGGSILLKFETGTLGTSLITASSGAGGTNAGSFSGGAGSTGRIHADYSSSYSGTTSPSIDVTLDTSIVSVGGTTNNFLLMF